MGVGLGAFVPKTPKGPVQCRGRRGPHHEGMSRLLEERSQDGGTKEKCYSRMFQIVDVHGRGD